MRGTACIASPRTSCVCIRLHRQHPLEYPARTRSMWSACQSKPRSVGCHSALQVDLSTATQPFRVEFPHLGSGLLFARSTGLKVWPGSEVLARLLLSHMPQVASHHPGMELPSNAQHLCNRLVLELGAGLGVASLAAASQGAQVIATDGDPDLVRLLNKNLAHNWMQQHTAWGQGCCHGLVTHPAQPRAAVLPWGDTEALARLKSLRPQRARGGGQQQQPVLPASGHADVVLMADLVYGSNPGVWDRLVSTLTALTGPSTLVLQAETRRIEGVLYPEYWQRVVEAGFTVHELDLRPVLGESVPQNPHEVSKGGDGDVGPSEPFVRAWVLHR